MRRGFGLLGLLGTVILLVIVGAIAYNIGYSDGLSTHLPAAANGAVAPYYYYGFGHPFGFGFGLFGIFWFLLILFGILWLLRLAVFGFWGRRMWGGGWGYGRGFGPGAGGPGGRWGSFEERAQEWHRKQHGETPPPPPTETRSV
ncbi:MAG TPA: hypothetical protein VFL27_03155 [Candidatus Dormibacteraeota bacterium]|nr:hypothetical protein [Candidatus Dormibacteraeota bacterium]